MLVRSPSLQQVNRGPLKYKIPLEEAEKLGTFLMSAEPTEPKEAVNAQPARGNLEAISSGS